MTPRPLRSVLYVPGDKPRAIEKARTLNADAVILDLEDAVAPEHKARAREHIREALGTPWPMPVMVRVNGLGSAWEHDDRELALTAGATGIVLPKVEAAQAVHELSLGLPLWAMIETPLGVLNAAALAALPGVAGLLVGANDLARALRTRADPDRLPLLHALGAVVLAARAHGKIHPDQIDPANAAYGVTDDEAHTARALIDAWTAARAEGRSVATYQGALVEQMHVDEAQDVLALWEGTRGR